MSYGLKGRHSPEFMVRNLEKIHPSSLSCGVVRSLDTGEGWGYEICIWVLWSKNIWQHVTSPCDVDYMIQLTIKQLYRQTLTLENKATRRMS